MSGSAAQSAKAACAMRSIVGSTPQAAILGHTSASLVLQASVHCALKRMVPLCAAPNADRGGNALEVDNISRVAIAAIEWHIFLLILVRMKILCENPPRGCQSIAREGRALRCRSARATALKNLAPSLGQTGIANWNCMLQPSVRHKTPAVKCFCPAVASKSKKDSDERVDAKNLPRRVAWLKSNALSYSTQRQTGVGTAFASTLGCAPPHSNAISSVS